MPSNILIVDDMMLNRKLMKSVLSGLEGVEFLEANDGEMALDIVSKEDIDLIILDLVMPKKDGFEVLRELKKSTKHRSIPVIVNSAIHENQSVHEALELGAYDYLTKPLTPQQMRVILPLKVENALRNYEYNRYLAKINAQLEEELNLARSLQESLIRVDHNLTGAKLYSYYRPSMEIGGDFFACKETDDTLWFIIADVSGHGVVSAMITAMIQAEFSRLIQSIKGPKDLLEEMNRSFYALTQGKHYFTSFIGCYKDQTLTYANSGHPYPSVIDGDGNFIVLSQKSHPVALFEDVSFEEELLTMGKGSMIFLHTDGLSDNIRDRFDDPTGMWRSFIEDATRSKDFQPEQAIDKINTLYSDLEGVKLHDDIAVLIIKFLQ